MVNKYFEDHINNMDQNQYGQQSKEISPPTQEADEKNQNQSNHMIAPTNTQTDTVGPFVLLSYPREEQCAAQYMYLPQQDHLQQQLNNLWAKKREEIEETTNFSTHNFPLVEIKKIMKDDEDVKMISAEAPAIFAEACEMFTQELVMRAWANAEVNKRRTLQMGDIADAISRTDEFDFLADIVPRDDTVEQDVFAGIPRKINAQPENVPSPSYGAPRMVLGRHVVDENNNGQQIHPFPTPVRPTPKHQDSHSSDSDD